MKISLGVFIALIILIILGVAIFVYVGHPITDKDIQTTGSLIKYGPISFSLPWKGIASTETKSGVFAIIIPQHGIQMSRGELQLRMIADPDHACYGNKMISFKKEPLDGYYCTYANSAIILFKDPAGEGYSMVMLNVTSSEVKALINSLSYSL